MGKGLGKVSCDRGGVRRVDEAAIVQQSGVPLSCHAEHGSAPVETSQREMGGVGCLLGRCVAADQPGQDLGGTARQPPAVLPVPRIDVHVRHLRARHDRAVIGCLWPAARPHQRGFCVNGGSQLRIERGGPGTQRIDGGLKVEKSLNINQHEHQGAIKHLIAPCTNRRAFSHGHALRVDVGAQK